MATTLTVNFDPASLSAGLQKAAQDAERTAKSVDSLGDKLVKGGASFEELARKAGLTSREISFLERETERLRITSDKTADEIKRDLLSVLDARKVQSYREEIAKTTAELDRMGKSARGAGSSGRSAGGGGGGGTGAAGLPPGAEELLGGALGAGFGAAGIGGLGPLVSFAAKGLPFIAKMTAALGGLAVPLGALAAIGVGVKKTFDSLTESITTFDGQLGTVSTAIVDVMEWTGRWSGNIAHNTEEIYKQAQAIEHATVRYQGLTEEEQRAVDFLTKETRAREQIGMLEKRRLEEQSKAQEEADLKRLDNLQNIDWHIQEVIKAQDLMAREGVLTAEKLAESEQRLTDLKSRRLEVEQEIATQQEQLRREEEQQTAAMIARNAELARNAEQRRIDQARQRAEEIARIEKEQQDAQLEAQQELQSKLASLLGAKGGDGASALDSITGSISGKDVDSQVKRNRRAEMERRQAEVQKRIDKELGALAYNMSGGTGDLTDAQQDRIKERRRELMSEGSREKRAIQRDVFGKPVSDDERNEATKELVQANLEVAASQAGVNQEAAKAMAKVASDLIDTKQANEQLQQQYQSIMAQLGGGGRKRAQRSGRN